MGTLAEELSGKRFGLVLSSGFFGFYGHAGFLLALEKRGLQPEAFAGTSAGGLVGAYAAAGLSGSRIAQLIGEQERRAFWDPDPLGAVASMVRRGPHGTGLLKGQRFRALIERTLPVARFEDCRQPLVLVAANISQGKSEVFTSGELAPRVHATCAYPGMFRAVRLGQDDYWDGGLVDKAPALALADSEAGKGLDALLVHFLPSRADGPVRGPFAYAYGMAAGLAALRRDHFELQLRVLRGRGLPVYVITSELPAVSPRAMHKGRDVIALAREAVDRHLSEPFLPMAN